MFKTQMVTPTVEGTRQANVPEQKVPQKLARLYELTFQAQLWIRNRILHGILWSLHLDTYKALLNDAPHTTLKNKRVNFHARRSLNLIEALEHRYTHMPPPEFPCWWAGSWNCPALEHRVEWPAHRTALKSIKVASPARCRGRR